MNFSSIRQKNLILLTVALLCSLVDSISFAEKEKGGGDYEKLKFAIVANKVADLVRKNASKFPEINLDRLSQAIKNTRVEFANDRPDTKEGPRDNSNSPRLGLIEMNRFKWREAFGKPALQASMVLHEYLGVMRIDDSNHFISNRMATVATSQPASFFRFSCSVLAYVKKGADSSELTWIIGEGDTAGEAWNEILEIKSPEFKEMYRRTPGPQCVAWGKVSDQLTLDCIKLNQKEAEENAATIVNSCVRNY